MKQFTGMASLSLPQRWGAIFFLVALGLIGCRNEEEQVVTEEGPYQMGAPITDTTYAVIIESSEYGDDTLTTAEFRERLNQRMRQFPGMALDSLQQKQLRRALAEEFVMRHLLGGEAQRLNIDIDSATVEQQVALIRSNFNSEEEFQQVLSMQGLTLDSLRSAIREDMRLQQVQERILEDVEEPTTDDIEVFRQEQAEQIRAQHILFRVPEPSQADEVRAQAEAVLDSIKAGASFEEMAGRYGTDATAQSGGDLGYFSRAEMVEPFSEAAFSIQDSGAVYPEPVKTRFGYHLIRLMDRRTTEPMDTARARASLQQLRQRDVMEAAIEQLRGKATIHLNPEVVDVTLNEGLQE